MKRDDLPPPMEGLDARIREARDAREDAKSNGQQSTGLAWAARLTTEMFAALVVGGGLGWLVDRWLGTRPWFMLVFLLIGCAAGMLNAYRAARRFDSSADDGVI